MRAVKISDYHYIENTNSEIFALDEKIQGVAQDINDRIADLLGECLSECGLTLEELLLKREEKLEQLQEDVDDVYGAIDGYYEDRSEDWMESDKGEIYSDWRDLWSEFQSQVSHSCVEINVFNFMSTTAGNEGFGLDIGITDDIEIPPRTPNDM